MPALILLGLFLVYCMTVARPADIEHGRRFWKRWEKVLLVIIVTLWASVLIL